MNAKITIDCENMSEENINELYYQLSIKTSPYGTTMDIEKGE